MKLALKLFTRWEVKGKQNVPRKGPFIVVSNHLSMADPPLLSASIPRHIVFMAKEELFRWIGVGFLVRTFGAIKLHKNQADRKALRQARQALSKGMALGIFPEGGRSRDHKLQPAHPGAAMLALDNNTIVLPVAITGTEKVSGLRWLLRPHIVVNIGQPFTLAADSAQSHKQRISQGTETMMSHIAELLPPEFRGQYGGETSMAREAGSAN